MHVLFLHQNFPGQFIHIASELVRRGHSVRALVPEQNTRPRIVKTESHAYAPPAADAGQRDWAFSEQADRGLAAAEGMMRLRRDGYTPDVVVGHAGWGETLFVRDVWAHCRIIVHAEFYYSGAGNDVGFDREFQAARTLQADARLRGRNAAMLQAISEADVAVAPTEWQARCFPELVQPKLAVVHEGIDTHAAMPNGDASVRLQRDNLVLRPGDEVVTFINRNLEPYRGYHQFMRALPEVFRRRPKARAVIVGGNGVSYGPKLAGGRSWKDHVLNEVKDKLDMSRVHFVGTLPKAKLISLLQVSAAHVYLTYPFVLSWSMLEAMSIGCAVIGSRTAPVEEVITDGVNGLLIDFFSHEALADRIDGVLAEPAAFAEMRSTARKCVLQRYDLRTICLPQWTGLVEGGGPVAAEPKLHFGRARAPADFAPLGELRN